MLILSTLLGYIRKYKAFVIAAGFLVAFASGWTVSGWQNSAELLSKEKAYNEALTKERARLLIEYEERVAKDQAARLALQNALDEARTRRDSLLVEVETMEAGCGENGGNPVSPDFIRLWNDSGRP